MSQIQKKFIGDNQVDGAKLLLLNGQMLRWRNAAGTADVNVLRVTTDNRAEFQVLPEALASLPMPSAPKQFATIEYIEKVVKGKGDAKDAVNFLVTGNVALSGLVDDLAAVSDGVVPASGNRVGLTFQTAAAENGVYDLTITGGSYSLARSADFDEGSLAIEVTAGAYFPVVAGTLYSGYEVQLVTPDPIEIGTTALTFVRYPSTLSLTAGDMLIKVGNDFSIDLAPLSGLESTNPGSPSGQLRVKTDTAVLEKGQTTRLDPTAGSVVAKRSKKLLVSLSSTDVANGYVDLPDVASDASVQLSVAGAGDQLEGDDFMVNYTGGAASKTRVLFAGGLAVGGVSALVAGDKVLISYTAF